MRSELSNIYYFKLRVSWFTTLQNLKWKQLSSCMVCSMYPLGFVPHLYLLIRLKKEKKKPSPKYNTVFCL